MRANLQHTPTTSKHLKHHSSAYMVQCSQDSTETHKEHASLNPKHTLHPPITFPSPATTHHPESTATREKHNQSGVDGSSRLKEEDGDELELKSAWRFCKIVDSTFHARLKTAMEVFSYEAVQQYYTRLGKHTHIDYETAMAMRNPVKKSLQPKETREYGDPTHSRSAKMRRDFCPFSRPCHARNIQEVYSLLLQLRPEANILPFQPTRLSS